MAGLPTHIIGAHEANSKTVALYEPARREHLTNGEFLSLSWSKFELALEHLRKENACEFQNREAGELLRQAKGNRLTERKGMGTLTVRAKESGKDVATGVYLGSFSRNRCVATSS